MDSDLLVRRTTFRNIGGLIPWFALCFLVSGVGAFFMPGPWYDSLEKPFWNPPGWVFGPVWSALYAMMAVSVWLIWKRGRVRHQRFAIGLFLLQLIFNMLWSPLFFGLQMPGLAFAEIVVLWLSIVATIWAFSRVSAVAAWLLVPYVAWVSFAAVLNFTLWQLNK